MRMKGIVAAVLTLALAACMCPAAALANQGGYQAAAAPALLVAQSAKSGKWVVRTKDYRFTIPKYWRGKVQWKTTSYRWQNNVGKWRKSYHTSVYLKGHKGDNAYKLVDVGHTTGFGSDEVPLVTKYTKRQDHPYFRLHVTVLAINYPYKVWAYAHGETPWNMPTSVKAQKKLLKLSTGNKVSYKAARKSADYGTKNYKAVANYLKPKFEKSLKVLV